MDYNNPTFQGKDKMKLTEIALKETGTNMGKGSATEGSALAARNRSGLYLSYRQVGLVIGVVLLIVLIIALAAGVNHHMTRDYVAGASLSNTASGNHNLLWNNINLPDSVAPTIYTLTLSIHPEKTRFTGSVEITFECRESTRFVVLHVNGLTIYPDQVTILQKTLQQKLKIVQQFAHEKYQYYVIEVEEATLELGQEYSLRFEKFDGEISRTTTNGLFGSKYSNAKGVTNRYLLATNLNPIHARRVFPCFDEPSKKAVFNVIINHPTIYNNVLFNTRRLSRTAAPGSNQWTRDTFSATPLLSPHLLAIFIADRNYVHEAVTSSSQQNILLWAPSRYLSQTTLAQAAANASFYYYSNYLDADPSSVMSHHVAIPEYPSSITTGWGLFFYSLDDLLADNQHSYSVSSYKRAHVCLSVARKMAQMFFGSIVTPDRWSDMWVTEGISSVLAYDAVGTIEPSLSMDHFIIAMDVLPGFSLDSTPGTSFTLSYPLIAPSDTVISSHPLMKHKGSSVIAMTRTILGSEAFQNSLQKYIQRYKHQSKSVEALWSIMSKEVLNLYNMSRVVRTWSEQTGYPLVTLGEEFSHAHEMILVDQKIFRLDESSFLPKSPYDYVWNFQLNYATDQEFSFRRHRWIERRESRFNFPSSGTFQWLIGNVDFEYFHRINLPMNDWESVFILLGRDRHAFSPETRAMVYDSVFALAMTGRIEMTTLFRYMGALDKERSFLPWCAGMRALSYIRDRLQTTTLLGAFQRFIIDRIRGAVDLLGWSPKPRDTFQNRYLRMLLLEAAVKNSASYREVLDFANIIFTNWKDNPNSIQSDQQYAVFYAGIGEGTVSDWDRAWDEMQYTINQDYRGALLYGLSAAREPWVLRRYLNRCLNHTSLTRAQGARGFMQVVQSDYGRSGALEFFKDNWAIIYKRFAGTHTFPDLLEAVIDVSSSNFEVNELQKLFTSLSPTSPLATRVKTAIQRATWNIIWLKKNLKTLTKLLPQQ